MVCLTLNWVDYSVFRTLHSYSFANELSHNAGPGATTLTASENENSVQTCSADVSGIVRYRSIVRSGYYYIVQAQHFHDPTFRGPRRSATPWSNLISYGGQAFSIAAPFEWNKLPSDLKNWSSYNAFKSKLKTLLFKDYNR